MEIAGIEVVDLGKEVFVSLITTGIISLLIFTHAFTIRAGRNRTELADKLVALAELGGEIARAPLPNSIAGKDNPETQRNRYLYEISLSEFEKLVVRNSAHFSDAENEAIRQLVRASHQYNDYIGDEYRRRSKEFWTAFQAMLAHASNASKALRRRGRGRRQRIQALHDIMTDNGGEFATQAAAKKKKSDYAIRQGMASS